MPAHALPQARHTNRRSPASAGKGSGASLGEQPPWGEGRRRRAQEAHATQEELLQAARRVFTSHSFERTSIRMITDEAQVSRSAFYAYFVSKDEVLLALARAARDDVVGAHEIFEFASDDVRGLARASTRAFLAAAAEHGPLLGVMETQAKVIEEVGELLFEIRERPARRMIAYVSTLVDQGIADPAGPLELISEMLSGLFVRISNDIPTDPAAFEALVDDVTGLYLRLIGVPAGR